MNKKETRIFNPVRVRNTSRLKTLLCILLAIVIAAGGAAGFYVYKNGVDAAKSLIKKGAGLFESDSTDTAGRKTYKGVSANFLIMSISSAPTQETGAKEIYFMAIAHADAGTGQIKLCPITAKPTYLSLYESGGADSVTKEVAKEYGIVLKKYICSDENTFALAVNYMGGLECNVPERVEYRTPDLTLILTPGEQTIKGEVLIKYLKYFKAYNSPKLTEMLCQFITECFTQDNFDNAMTVYKNVLSNLSGNSNISFIDAADNLKYVKTVIENPKTKVVSVKSVEEF